MMKQSREQFDAVMFLRPDVEYIDPFPIDCLNQLDDETCLFPNWHLYGKGSCRVNDRFQVMCMKLADKIGLAFNELLSFSKTNKIHSETFMSHICEKNAIQCKYINKFKFLRIRADGKIPNIDQNLLSIDWNILNNIKKH